MMGFLLTKNTTNVVEGVQHESKNSNDHSSDKPLHRRNC